MGFIRRASASGRRSCLIPLLVLSACSAALEAPETSASLDLTLDRAGGCVDSVLAAGPWGDHQLVVLREASMGSRACSAGGPVTETFAANDPRVGMKWLVGRNLSVNYCTDAYQGGRHVSRVARPQAGTVTITYTPHEWATDLEPTGIADVVIDGVTWRWDDGTLFTQTQPWEFRTWVGVAFPAWDTANSAQPCIP